jgi:hypothetical protein
MKPVHWGLTRWDGDALPERFRFGRCAWEFWGQEMLNRSGRSERGSIEPVSKSVLPAGFRADHAGFETVSY